MVGLQGEKRVFVKRIMMIQYEIEQVIKWYVGNDSVLNALCCAIVKRGMQEISRFDALGRGYTLYWVGHTVVCLVVRIPYQKVKGACQWAFEKSGAEETVIRRACRVKSYSVGKENETGSIRRRRERCEARLEEASLSWEDYGRVALRGLIVYYVAWCTTALVSQLLPPFALKRLPQGDNVL